MRKTTLILAAIAALFMATPSEASLVLTIDDLSTPGIDVIVVDNSALGTGTTKGASTIADSFVGAGAVQYSGSVGTFLVQVTVGTSKPLPPNSSTLAYMDLLNLSVSGGAGNLLIMLTDTDFVLDTTKTGTWGFMNLSIGGTLNPGSVLRVGGTIDNSNAEFGAGSPSLGTTFVSPGGGFFGENLRTGGVDLTGPFSLTQTIGLSHDRAGASSFNSELSVPEPASAALLALGLAGLIARRRRRSA